MAEYLPPELAKLLRDGLWGSKQAILRIQLRYGSGRSVLLEAGKNGALVGHSALRRGEMRQSPVLGGPESRG